MSTIEVVYWQGVVLHWLCVLACAEHPEVAVKRKACKASRGFQQNRSHRPCWLTRAEFCRGRQLLEYCLSFVHEGIGRLP